MARHKEFSPDQVVDKALALFRLRGYEATSVDDLVQYLGIGRGSLYATFENKHALYLAALDRYLEPATESTPVMSDDAKATIAAILVRQADEAMAGVPLGGCFLVNSVVELGGHDAEVARRISANLDRAEGMFYEILSQDPLRADSPAERRRLAQFFINTSLGLRVLAKAGATRAMLTNVVDIAIGVLG